MSELGVERLAFGVNQTMLNERMTNELMYQ
jgi:hypothetical protein